MPSKKINPTQIQNIKTSPRIRLGLCCINETLKTKNIKNNRTVSRKNFTPEKAIDLSVQNCKDILEILKWNEKQNPPIKVFRLSSDLFPRFTDPKIESYDPFPNCQKYFKLIKDFCLKHGHRIVMHPGQYNQIGTPTESVYQSTIADLSYQAKILESIGLPPESSVMIVHGGGTYNDKTETIRRWKENFKLLPKIVRERITIENDERQYSISDVISIAEELDIPVTYDHFHHECYIKNKPSEQQPDPSVFLPKVLATWKKGVRPLMHTSNQGEGKTGHHSDYISRIPDYILNFCDTYGVGVDLEVEAKKKELAILKIIKNFDKKYF